MLRHIVLSFGLAALAAGGLDGQVRARSQAVRAFHQDYFPLQAGNSWTLESQGRFGGDVRNIRVTAREKIDDAIYFRVEGLQPDPALLRRNALGQIVQRTDNGEGLWYDFGASTGTSWHPERQLDCLGQATLASRGESVETLVRTFLDPW